MPGGLIAPKQLNRGPWVAGPEAPVISLLLITHKIDRTIMTPLEVMGSVFIGVFFLAIVDEMWFKRWRKERREEADRD